jgi:hypothetical protein
MKIAFNSEPKKKILPAAREVEGFDAHAIAAQHQAAGGDGPQGHGEHATQARKGAGIPFQECVQHGFGVALRMEAMAEAFELGTQFQMIVDLPVEDNDGVSVVTQDGLLASLNIDNFQASRAEGDRG